MDTRLLAQKLVRQHETRDPFRIAAELGYVVIRTPLVGIRGFYQYVKRCHLIYLDDSLSEQDAAFVCAHELGHSFMHRGLNRIFMDTRTLLVTSRYETEADRFAADLLFPDEVIDELKALPSETVAACLGMPEPLAIYRLRQAINAA